jgi:hypothetical protein
VSLALLSLGSHPASVNGPVKADFSASCCNLGKQSQHVIVPTARFPSENAHSIEVSASSMTKSRGCSAGMRVAYEQHQEIPIASVDHRGRRKLK